MSWDRVALDNEDSSGTSRFRAILFTDGTASYAIFNYDCGDMHWSGATIGWAFSDTLYDTHPLSGSNSADIGCEYSTTYSAIVYRLDICTSEEFTCDNGECKLQQYVCDGFDNCKDGSDELQNCDESGVNTALVVGLCVPLSCIACCCCIPICIWVMAYYFTQKSKRQR